MNCTRYSDHKEMQLPNLCDKFKFLVTSKMAATLATILDDVTDLHKKQTDVL